VGYIIEADGSTSGHAVVAVWPSELFNQAALDAAKKFTYEPAPGNVNREPIYTTNAFTFQLGAMGEEFEPKRLALAKTCDEAAHKALTAAPEH
jgi:hypothetical protein